MLVVDADSRQYLGNMRGLLDIESYFILFDQGWQEDAFDGPIDSIEKYQAVFQHDLEEPGKWEVWHDGRWVDVTLPGFAGRPRPRSSYLREFSQAGFSVQHVAEHSNGHMLDFVLRMKGIPLLYSK
jgi:hypothetical protein